MGCHSLLQGIILTPGIKISLPHCSQILYHLSHQRNLNETAGSSAWWRGPGPAPGEWRSLTRAPGAPSVMMAGTWTMPAWCAGSWAVEKPSVLWSLLPLGQDQDPSGWTTCIVEEWSPTCGSALPGAGGDTTAVMTRMQELSAQV
ncbi:hypothetical protein R6Z07F_005288 [Ovis aries]